MRCRDDLHAYRDEIKGIAILWIVFFHATLPFSGIVYDIHKIGYGGVDIFFFLMGFGLFFSLEKSSEMRGYALRRAKRILPAYLPFCVLWLAVMLPMFGLSTVQSIRTAMGNLLLIGYFASVPKMINWYLSGLVLMIFVAPFVYSLLKNSKKRWLALLALIVIAFGVGLCFIGDERYMAISRLPIFILGMAFAMPEWRKLPKGTTVILGAASFAMGLSMLMFCFARYPELLNDYGMYWHPFVLIVPPLCAGIGWLLRRVEKARAVLVPFRFLGRASFEIFLFNCWVEVLCKQFGVARTPLAAAIWSVGSIAVGCAYHMVVNACMKRADKRFIGRAVAQKEEKRA